MFMVKHHQISETSSSSPYNLTITVQDLSGAGLSGAQKQLLCHTHLDTLLPCGRSYLDKTDDGNPAKRNAKLAHSMRSGHTFQKRESPV